MLSKTCEYFLFTQSPIVSFRSTSQHRRHRMIHIMNMSMSPSTCCTHEQAVSSLCLKSDIAGSEDTRVVRPYMHMHLQKTNSPKRPRTLRQQAFSKCNPLHHLRNQDSISGVTCSCSATRYPHHVNTGKFSRRHHYPNPNPVNNDEQPKRMNEANVARGIAFSLPQGCPVFPFLHEVHS